MRFAVIDMLDCIVFESNNLFDCLSYCAMLDVNIDDTDLFRGLYDYERHTYLTIDDVIEMTRPM